MLALPLSSSDLGDDKLVTSSMCTLTRNFEPAGHTFEFRLDMKLGYVKVVDIETEDLIDDAKDEGEVPINMENLNNKRRKQSWVDKDGLNYYEALHLPSKHLVTDEMIRKSYMKLALIHHPDKKAENYDEEAKKKWLTVS